jgi:hypothetical protein
VTTVEIPEEVVGECIVCMCDFGSGTVPSGEMIQGVTWGSNRARETASVRRPMHCKVKLLGESPMPTG